MLQQEAEIINRLGLHARASARLTEVAGRFACNVFVSRNGRKVNAKSIMGVMMLAAAKGSTIMIETDGADEDAAMTAVSELIASRFGEEE